MEKGRLTFIPVEDPGLDSRGAKGGKPADAQQDFLHNTRGAVASIDAECEVAKMLLVFGPIGIQQINRNPADVYAPGLESDLVHADIDMANEWLALFVEHRFNREVLRV